MIKLPEDTVFRSAEFIKWRVRWQARLSRQSNSRESSFSLMQAHNHTVIPRNHYVEAALAAASTQGDYSLLQEFACGLLPTRTPMQQNTVFTALHHRHQWVL